MRCCFAILLGLVLQSASPAQTPVLKLAMSVPKDGDERNFEVHRRKQAQLCAKAQCPQHYVVLQPLTSTRELWSAAAMLNHSLQVENPGELWWLAVYASSDDEQKDRDWYLNDAPCSLRKSFSLRQTMGTGLPPYRPELSRWTPWNMGEAPFLVITISDNPVSVNGAVFAGFTKRYIIVSPAQTRSDADAIAASAGSEAVVLAVRPDLSFPEKNWIVANPQLWAKPASEKDIRQVIAADQMPQ